MESTYGEYVWRVRMESTYGGVSIDGAREVWG